MLTQMEQLDKDNLWLVEFFHLLLSLLISWYKLILTFYPCAPVFSPHLVIHVAICVYSCSYISWPFPDTSWALQKDLFTTDKIKDSSQV